MGLMRLIRRNVGRVRRGGRAGEVPLGDWVERGVRGFLFDLTGRGVGRAVIGSGIRHLAGRCDLLRDRRFVNASLLKLVLVDLGDRM